MIIATAGHVDHGKTSLLQALTGVNADRLPEEKSRGMTIDLGYVYWPQPDGAIVGFIDVPGHEKFLSNMLSGIGGIDHALLVVAADDGVMPQTREHLAILQLGGRPPLTVAITKSDSVEAERLADVAQQINVLTQQMGWQQVAQFPTSTLNGEGIAALADHLRQLPAGKSRRKGPFRLAIDRVFNVKGAGLVVTGTALSGEICVGDTLWLSGANQAVRVRGLHVQNQPNQTAHGGQRVALNIAGSVEKSAISRGDWLLSVLPETPCERVIVALEQQQPLRQGQPLHLHHGARHITGRLSLLADNLAELLLDTPLWLADNDRLILRDIGAKHTLAAARVLLLASPKRGKRQPGFLAWLHQLEQAREDAEIIALYLQQRPRPLSELSWARQLHEKALVNLDYRLRPEIIAGHMILPQMIQDWQQRLLDEMTHYHRSNSDRPGLGRDRLRRMALPDRPSALAGCLIDGLIGSGRLVNSRGWLHLPDFAIRFEPQEAALWQRAEPLFTDNARWVRDLALALNCPEDVMRQALRKAAQSGLIVAVVKDRYYSHSQITRFADIIRQRDAEGLGSSAADFRDRLGVGRKLAIQILEFFDRSGFTRRKGNEHLLRDGGMFL
ncbi:selenocysteine-specific translation elongation factor [Pantoea coffeiphila]|uniref:selenocysteine-specific translation elongation factor n=1 Tax=Pantoea coffeiphila TaxID=1465635 RepID=UPI0019616775|nr:selenocysteine-specific translation elongation factor [Pantoea coffeiphila]MBM7345556.1 selenocysteine-specific elongation factor [Pantoea coffeiphila]